MSEALLDSVLQSSQVMSTMREFAKAHDRVQQVVVDDFPKRVVYDRRCPVLCEASTPNVVLALQKALLGRLAQTLPLTAAGKDIVIASEAQLEDGELVVTGFAHLCTVAGKFGRNPAAQNLMPLQIVRAGCTRAGDFTNTILRADAEPHVQMDRLLPTTFKFFDANSGHCGRYKTLSEQEWSAKLLQHFEVDWPVKVRLSFLRCEPHVLLDYSVDVGDLDDLGTVRLASADYTQIKIIGVHDFLRSSMSKIIRCVLGLCLVSIACSTGMPDGVDQMCGQRSRQGSAGSSQQRAANQQPSTSCPAAQQPSSPAAQQPNSKDMCTVVE